MTFSVETIAITNEVQVSLAADIINKSKGITDQNPPAWKRSKNAILHWRTRDKHHLRAIASISKSLCDTDDLTRGVAFRIAYRDSLPVAVSRTVYDRGPLAWGRINCLPEHQVREVLKGMLRLVEAELVELGAIAVILFVDSDCLSSALTELGYQRSDFFGAPCTDSNLMCKRL